MKLEIFLSCNFHPAFCVWGGYKYRYLTPPKREASSKRKTQPKLMIAKTILTVTMEPDELYTLRAQYWLGHYKLCLEETKAVARRPMSAELKVEREEFALRSLLALKQHDKVISESSLSQGPGTGLIFVFLFPIFCIPRISLILRNFRLCAMPPNNTSKKTNKFPLLYF